MSLSTAAALTQRILGPLEIMSGASQLGIPEVSGVSPAAPATATPHPGEPKLGPYDRYLFYLMVAILHLLSLLPDFVLYPLGTLGGLIGYMLDRRHVRIGLKNIKLAFARRSEKEQRHILRASYVNLGRDAAEYIRLGGFFRNRLKRRITYERLEYWQKIAARHHGRGILVLSAHFGNFELLAPAHALHGFQISLLHHTQRFLAGDALLTFVRERAGVRIIRKNSTARAVLTALRRNQLVGIPFDQNAKRNEAVWVPFFGEPAATTTGLARLAEISGAPVVPVFIVRQPDCRSHRIVIQDEIPLARDAHGKLDIEQTTARFVRAIEEIVAQYPEQFLWTHRRYRTRPDCSMPPFYDS
jgi:Kdo2-lipid IVA lauroyltransferase/acyltransferase